LINAGVSYGLAPLSPAAPHRTQLWIESPDATLRVRTYGGSFRSTFPVKLDDPDRRNRFTLTLGDGSARVELESFNGGIALRRPTDPRPLTGRERRDRDRQRQNGQPARHPPRRRRPRRTRTRTRGCSSAQHRRQRPHANIRGRHERRGLRCNSPRQPSATFRSFSISSGNWPSEALAHEVTATVPLLRASLFGPEAVAAAVIARVDDAPQDSPLLLHLLDISREAGAALEDLYVRPAWRKRGIGRALLAHLARIAVERDCGRMEWSVLNWNELALGVYRAIGAKPMTEWTVQRLTGTALTALAATAPAVPGSSDR
jgi:GNAT superfamily N-acetyltransferase